MISLQCVDLLSFDFGAIWLQQIQFGTISFQWVCFHLIWSDLATVGFFFNLGQTISLQWILLSFDLERFGYSEFSFSTISFGDDFSTVDLLPFNLERFGCSEWIQLGTDDFAYSGFDFNLIGS